MKTIEITVDSYCNNCGREKNTSLIRMQHGFAWFCLPCQLKYRIKAFIGKRTTTKSRFHAI